MGVRGRGCGGLLAVAITYVGVSNAVAQSAGTTTTAGSAAITPTMPAGAATDDRVVVIQAIAGPGSQQSSTPPTGWTTLSGNILVGTGTVAAGSGQRHMAAFYRDYDGVWTMPAWGVTPATQNSHAIVALAVRKDAGDTWDTPTLSVAAADFGGTVNTTYSATTGSTFDLHAGGFVIGATAYNDNVTTSAQAWTGSVGSFGTVTERSNGGTTTGNDVSIAVETAAVAVAGTGTLTRTATLSAASEGATVWIEQTVTSPAGNTGAFFVMF